MTIYEYLTYIFGELPYGYDFIFYLIGGLLLVFVFHVIEEIFTVFFSKFF